MRECPECFTRVDGIECWKCGFKERPPATPARKPVQTDLDHRPIAAEVLAEIRRVGAKPKPDPRDWARSILDARAAGTYRHSYGIACATEVLRELPAIREPGEDDA